MTTDLNRRSAVALMAALLSAPSWAAVPAGQRLSAAARRRIDRLVADMTPAELAGQLGTEGAWSPRLAISDFFATNPFMPPVTPELGAKLHREQLDRVRAGAVGLLMGSLDLDTVEGAQRVAVKESRLKIPLIFAADVIHGHRIAFPIPLGEAASWEPDLARRTARAAAVEATRFGLDMTFAPMVDIGRDQRWGRVAEGAGEDVLLGQRFAAARVQGFQNNGDLRGADTLLACPKHFAAYGAAESGLDYAGADVPERLLREVYLPPFQAAFDAGAVATMASFNTVDGVPATGSRQLLTDILRGEFKFPGFVISDFNSINELVMHGTASDDADAAAQALRAGCDLAMLADIYVKQLPALVKAGKVPRALLETAVRRMLFVKEVAGLFDDPFRRISRERYASTDTDAAHRALAREAGRRSVVLLKNEGGVLPLAATLKRVALIGPFGEDTANANGPWGPVHVRVPPVTLAQGLRAAMPGTEWRIVKGSDIEAPLAGGEAAAREAADWAEVVVLAVGEHQDMSGEAHSRTQITLPAPQQALAEAVARAGKPVVVVLRNGRALALHGALRDAQAIVVGWFLGTETGHALADVLTGAYSPSGRLPVSFPLDSGQQPLHYARAPGGRAAPPDKPLAKFSMHFIGLPDAPLYPFGHGLGYGQVQYGAVQLGSATLSWNGSLELTAEVRNTGSRACEEVVQLYVRDRVASVSRPVRELKGFQKVALAAGESRTVRFTLTRADLQFVGSDLKWRAEPGEFDVWVAPSAAAGQAVRFRLVA